jgi:hypothetical protein
LGITLLFTFATSLPCTVLMALLFTRTFSSRRAEEARGASVKDPSWLPAAGLPTFMAHALARRMMLAIFVPDEHFLN